MSEDIKKITIESKTAELSDDELQDISGGKGLIQYKDFCCNKCGSIFKADLSKSSVVCPICGKRHQLMG